MASETATRLIAPELLEAAKGKFTWEARQTPEKNAQRVLPEAARLFFAAGRSVCQEGTDLDHLHRFRLAGKKLRYLLETMRSLYGKELEARLKALQKVQTLLGDLNDCVATEALLRQGSHGKGSVNRAFAAWLQSEAERRAEAFRVHWREVFDAPGQEEKWQKQLGQPVRLQPQPVPAEEFDVDGM